MIVIAPDRLATFDPAAMTAATECVVAMGEGVMGGDAVAALLFSDYAVVARDAEISIDGASAWAGVVWRLGHAAVGFLATVARGSAARVTAIEAERAGLVDAVADDLDRWRIEFLDGRSEIALDAAAMLLVRHGGDALERAEFARLFAIGEPQRGLRAFLEARSRS